jgi:hypothetical protein
MKYKFRNFLRDDQGSLSVLILAFLLASILVLMALTNISSIYLAKRTLTQGTEAATQRGVRNLNFEKYYEKQSILLDSDPGIPIDCSRGRKDALDAMDNWISLSKNEVQSLGRANLIDAEISEFHCDGYEISLSTLARIKLPFAVPIFGIEEVQIRSQVSSIAERKITSNFYGIDIN